MENKQKVIELLNSLNVSGMNLAKNFLESIVDIEKYNVNTSDERLEELKQISKRNKQENEKQIEKMEYEKAIAEHKERDKRIESLSSREKRFLTMLNNTTVPGRYCMSMREIELLAKVFNNNFIDGSFLAFKYGYIKSKREIETEQKKVTA